MFCGSCGASTLLNQHFCTNCGSVLKKESDPGPTCRDSFGQVQNLPTALSKESEPGPSGSFGRVNSYATYKRQKGQEWKESVSKKGKGKKANETPDNKNTEVIIYIGLATWNFKCDCLKKMHGRRLALRVNKKDSPATLLEKAVTKWKAYKSDCYCEGKEYLLLLEDFQEAVFLPGTSCREFFTLERYQQELGKDFKRITLYICTKSDFHLHECGGYVEEEKLEKGKCMDGGDVENAVVIEDSVFEKQGTSGHPPPPRQESNAKDYEESSSAQIRSDHDMALALHNSINSDDNDDKALCAVVPAPPDAVTDPASVVKFLQKKVIEDCHLFLTTRRGISLNRVVQLWQRERKKNPAEYKVCIKYLGEEGIDTGALSREFMADVINDIAKIMFPNGSPVYSTLFIQNGNFRTVGEIIAASLAQSGPPPCFLEESTYNMLVNPNVDLRSLDTERHLTPSEREQIDKIKDDLVNYQDIIIDHGYTGPIKEDMMDDIIGSIVISIVSRNLLSLGEFMEGLKAYGLKDLLLNNPESCRPLFVKGHYEAVDANYLLGLLEPEFSDMGTPERTVEEQVIDNFQDFLHRLEDEQITGYTSPVAWNYDCHLLEGSGEDDVTVDGEKYEKAELSAAGVMKWLTGQGHREITGDNLKISVKFNHTCKVEKPNHRVCFPYVGACGMEISFPVIHMSKYDEFESVFLLAFCKGQAFARH